MNEQTLTNKQTLEAKEGKDFLNGINDIFKNPFNKYIDLEKYFDAPAGTPVENFLMSKGTCHVKPSEVEIKVAENAGTKVTDEWIKEHTKEYPILDKCQVFGEEYVTVADIENNTVRKIPKKNVIELIEEP